MVAKVISGQDIKGALNYNEHKVQEGVAQCIQASGFTQDVDDLNFYDKLSRFTALNEHNTRTWTNTLHVSLNFDASEKLGIDQLNSIASAYMDKIGFGEQPYLVYEHRDAAHPHIHIVTTLIRGDGKRIPIHNLGRNESEKARTEIENEFGLVKAQGRGKDRIEVLRPADVQKAVYGKSETKRSISNIVRAVTHGYRYTSLHELNAVLRQYNVTADRGTDQSQMFRKKGLLYSLIDDRGKRAGIPVKASAIYGKPTLRFLEKQFMLNEVLRQPHREPLKAKIDSVLQSPAVNDRQQFMAALRQKGIAVIFRSNAEGRTYGVTLVDNNTRVVFNGSAFGKPYSANAILQRLSANAAETHRAEVTKTPSPSRSPHPVAGTMRDDNPRNALIEPSGELIKHLVTADSFDPLSPEAVLHLRKKRKKKSRRI